jgi:site-specific recombinase XerD
MKRKQPVLIKDFDAHIDEWLDAQRLFNHQPSSIEAGRKDIELFSRFCHEHHTRRITGKTLLRFVRWLHDERKNCSGTINRKRSSLCLYMRHLRLLHVSGAEDLPVASLPRARDAYRGPVNVLQPDEVRDVLQSFDCSSVFGKRDHALFTLQYALGLRLGEALAINLNDIDFRNKKLQIHGKGRKERTLPLTEMVEELLRSLLKVRTAILNSQTNPALFLSKKGNRLSLRTAEENFKKVIERIEKLKDRHVVPHTLRHSFASHALENGEGPNTIVVLKEILGHAWLKSTEIYMHPSINVQRKAINDHIASEVLGELRDKRTGIFRMQSARAG